MKPSRAAKPTNERTARALPKTISREDAGKLLAVPNVNTPTGLRNRALLELMYRCGLRISEATGLHLRDVKWADNRLHLRPEFTKGGKEAYVPVPRATMKGLERWKAVRREYAAGSQFLLTTLKGGQVNRQQAYQIVQTLARRGGLGKVNPHMLRHTFATEALADGVSIAEVQTLLRHSDVSTTMIYTHVVQPDLERKMADRGGEEW